MDDGIKLAIAVIIGIIICVCAMASCAHKVSVDDNQTMAQMVKEGADPIAAKCAVKGSSSTECGILAAAR